MSYALSTILFFSFVAYANDKNETEAPKAIGDDW